ncbi:hypothetical protein [Paracoccus litorisediminis]|uniref:PepSY domain-containing protein n=1 Tax=Paracoccus litorisediminis TaxID=2006130 RepID=A0A844HJ70_9RHOB|nr:hypothetical protein [Paracoccus litorisediminis]MTH59980.1 hypothetical protein [Paracoccus litorisediminis]
MSRYFTSSVAATALMALLAVPALAQDNAPAQAPAEHAAAEGKAPVELPQVLRDLGLTDVTAKGTRHGQRVSGKLPDGSWLNAMLDDGGELRGLRAGKNASLPATLIERLVPQAVRSQQVYGELGQIDAIFLGDKSVMLSGEDAQKNEVRAAFAEDGTLLRFGRGDDRGPKGHGKDHGRDHGKDRGDRDDRDGKHRDKDHGDREARGPRDDGPRGDMPAPAPDQIRANLTEAGYTEIGQILQQGPITIAQATNPEGEPVLVELGPKGRVVRELNR